MGGTAARRGAGGLRALLLALVAAGTPAGAYNLDSQRPVRFQGPAGSFFGYAVLEHFHDNTRWVLVGAPKADSKYSTSVKSPGAVFKCRIHTNPDRRCTELDMARGKNRGMSCGKTCREDRDDEWMGVSLARQPKADGRVLACAHRWKNIYYETDHILPHGFCYIIPSNLQAKGRTLIPCYEEYKKKYGAEHGSCQAGIAGFFTESSMLSLANGTTHHPSYSGQQWKRCFSYSPASTPSASLYSGALKTYHKDIHFSPRPQLSCSWPTAEPLDFLLPASPSTDSFHTAAITNF